MKRWKILTIFCTTTLLLGSGAQGKEISNAQVPKVQTIGKTATAALDFGKIPLYFIANNRQADKQARFYARTSWYTLVFAQITHSILFPIPGVRIQFSSSLNMSQCRKIAKFNLLGPAVENSQNTKYKKTGGIK
jgi:hypothetical protein